MLEIIVENMNKKENNDTYNTKIYDLSGFCNNKQELFSMIRQRIVRLFTDGEYATVEKFINSISYSELKELMEYKEGMIIEVIFLRENSQALNFFAEKVPKEITRAVLRNKDFDLIRRYFKLSMIMGKKGYLNDFRNQLRNEFIEIFLKIDREGISELVFRNKEFHEKISENLTSIKEEVEKILKKMDTMNQIEILE